MRLHAVLVSLGLLLLSACSLRSDEEQIRQAIEAEATSNDPGYCDALLTDTFLEQTTDLEPPYADEACEEAAHLPGAKSVGVRDIRIHGPRATASVGYQGGGFGGAHVLLALTSEDGDWKLDRIVRIQSLDKASYARSLADQLRDDEFAFSSDGAACVRGAVRRISEAQIRRAMLGRAERVFDRITVRCDRAAVERLMTAEFDKPPYDFFPSSLTSCLKRRVRALSDDELTRIIDDFVGYGQLGLGCGRATYLRAYESEIVRNGTDGAVADCVVDALREMPTEVFMRITYDEERYEELFDDCQE